MLSANSALSRRDIMAGTNLVVLVLASIELFAALTHSLDVTEEGTRYRCSSSKVASNLTSLETIHTVSGCRNKIRIVLTVKNVDKSPETVKYLFIKDVVDDETGIKLRLLNPLAVRFHQQQVLLGYPIRYLSAVNAKASEVVINYQNTKNFTGCDDTSPVNPTCGIRHHKGVSVEYSQGFCCFCPDTPSKGKQARGGQDCSLAEAPSPDYDLMSYKASAHCLKKDEIWYTVNALEEPIIMHEVFVQVYNQHPTENGSFVWSALTGDEDIALGNQNPHQYDENKTIALTYLTEKPMKNAITIKYEDDRLLVPQPVLNSEEEAAVPAPLQKGPSDYLIINKTLIQAHGDVCDTAGVSYEAFYHQKDRCSMAVNTCLKNQPLDIWKDENSKRESGKKGNHLLQFFGTPYKDPIMIDKETQEHWLVLEYYKSHVTYVYVETKADRIIALTPGKHAQIISVVAAAHPKSIDFHVVVLNSALASAEFTVKAVKCGYDVPDTDSQTRVISAQLKEDFTLLTKPGSTQLAEKFTCTVQVNSSLYGIVAKREIVIKPKTRCICNLHCLCVCLGESLKCEPMTEDDYHAAGFRGSLPVLTAKPPHKIWIVRHPLIALLSFLLIVLLFGFVKATIGFAKYEFIGEFGLCDELYKPVKLDRYPEPRLDDVEVMYDPEGYPLDPDTLERFKLFTPGKLFCMNFFFCFVYPFFLLRRRIRQKKQLAYLKSLYAKKDEEEEEGGGEKGERKEGDMEDDLEKFSYESLPHQINVTLGSPDLSPSTQSSSETGGGTDLTEEDEATSTDEVVLDRGGPRYVPEFTGTLGPRASDEFESVVVDDAHRADKFKGAATKVQHVTK